MRAWGGRLPAAVLCSSGPLPGPFSVPCDLPQQPPPPPRTCRHPQDLIVTCSTLHSVHLPRAGRRMGFRRPRAHARGVRSPVLLVPQCSRSCGGGSSTRDVQCVDTQDLRPLRPFHCQPGPAMPPARRPCGAQPCRSWYVSAWREVRPGGRGGAGVGVASAPRSALTLPSRPPSAQRLVAVASSGVW